MANPAYFVKDGHTLGYVNLEQPTSFWPIGAMPSMFSHNPMNGSVAFGPLNTLTPATIADFDKFRVHPPKGYFNG